MWKNVKLTFKNIVICGGGCTKNKLLINFDVEKKTLKSTLAPQRIVTYSGTKGSLFTIMTCYSKLWECISRIILYPY